MKSNDDDLDEMFGLNEDSNSPSPWSKNDQQLLELAKANRLGEFKLSYETTQNENPWDNEDVLDSCMLLAARNGNLEFIEFIYENCEHPFTGDPPYPFGACNTPLLEAARHGQIDVVKYLLLHEANSFAVDRHGANAVFNAILSGNIELVQFLIEECGLAWQGYTWEGGTALTYAVLSENPRMFGYVLRLGGLSFDNPKYCVEESRSNFSIRKFIKDHFNSDPKKEKEKKLGKKFLRILHTFIKEYDALRDPLYKACQENNFSKLKLLFDSYEYPVEPDALMNGACEGGSIEIFHYLLNEKHFSIPETTLEYAVCGANSELVEELVFDHHANVHAVDCAGKTLLHWAIADGNWREDMDPKGTVKIVKFLLKCGLDANASRPYGTPLTLAQEKGLEDIVHILETNNNA